MFSRGLCVSEAILNTLKICHTVVVIVEQDLRSKKLTLFKSTSLYWAWESQLTFPCSEISINDLVLYVSFSRSVEKRPIRLRLEIEAVIHTHSRKVGYTQIWETIKMISPLQEGEPRIKRMQGRIQSGLRTIYGGPPQQNPDGAAHAAGGSRHWHLQMVALVKLYMLSYAPISHKCSNFGNVMIPSTPTSPTFTLQLFFDSRFSPLNLWLLLVYFSFTFSKLIFLFRPDGQISSQPVWRM